MLAGRMLMAAGNSAYIANATDFDGSTYLQSPGALTGSVNGPRGTFNCNLRLDSHDGSLQTIATNGFFGGTMGFRVVRDTSNKIRVDLNNVSATKVFSFSTVSTFVASAAWINIQAAWDTNFSAGNKLGKIAINGVSDCAIISDADIAFDIDYAGGIGSIGADSNDTNPLRGCLAELYLDQTAYSDPTVGANNLRFRKASGKPQRLGSNGAAPTGTPPILYLKDPAATFGTNSGTGGNLSTLVGTPVTASTSPSD